MISRNAIVALLLLLPLPYKVKSPKALLEGARSYYSFPSIGGSVVQRSQTVGLGTVQPVVLCCLRKIQLLGMRPVQSVKLVFLPDSSALARKVEPHSVSRIGLHLVCNANLVMIFHTLPLRPQPDVPLMFSPHPKIRPSVARNERLLGRYFSHSRVYSSDLLAFLRLLLLHSPPS